MRDREGGEEREAQTLKKSLPNFYNNLSFVEPYNISWLVFSIFILYLLVIGKATVLWQDSTVLYYSGTTVFTTHEICQEKAR